MCLYYINVIQLAIDSDFLRCISCANYNYYKNYHELTRTIIKNSYTCVVKKYSKRNIILYLSVPKLFYTPYVSLLD